MPRKPKAKPDDSDEYRRFLETAEAVEAGTDPKAFDKAFKKIVPKPKAFRPRRGAKRPPS
jgi:hypothetical protein